MVKRITPSQYQQLVRRQNAEIDRVNRARKQAVQKINREIDRVNNHNKRVVGEYNRAVRQNNQNARAAVAKYNQAVRTHNNKVQQNKQSLRRQIEKLRNSQPTRYVEVRNSTIELSQRYEELEKQGEATSGVADLLALSEREASNSATVAEALQSETPQATDHAEDTGIIDYLAGFSDDLCDRWRGALYALNPQNTDAARHFCTSVREIFTEILDRWADNEEVIQDDPSCELTPNGTPSRRAKIRYLLRTKGADTPDMLGFVEQDIEDILQLFKVFNEATHGSAGKHNFEKLKTIRHRVEGGIMFLAAIAL